MKHLLRSFFIFLLLVSKSGISFAQSSSTPIVLDDIQINNQEVEIKEDKKIYGKEGDAIRIAGKLLSGDEVIIFVGNKEYVGNMDENNNWFVLFSITNFTEEQYPIEAQLIENNKKEDKMLLTTLILSEKPISEEDKNNSEIENSNIKFGFKDIVIIILSLSLAYTLLNYFILKSKVEKRNKKNK